MKVRHLIGAQGRPEFVAVTPFFAHHIESDSEDKLLNSFPLFEDTDQRVAFDGDLDLCVVGSWASGTKCFRLSTGDEIWNSPATKQYTKIFCFTRKRQITLTGAEPPGCLILDADTGELIVKDPERTLVFNHPEREIFVAKENGRGLVLDNEESNRDRRLEWNSFTALSLSFGSGSFLVSGPDGGLTCFDIQTGDVLGSLSKSGKFFNGWPLAYRFETRRYLAVLHEIEGTAKSALVKFTDDLQSAEVIAEFDPASGFAFYDSARKLITGNGEIWDTASGELIRQIDWRELLKS